MPNRLVHETSPYLLQHARNPVDWYPWGQEAFERAQQEDKPILASIGYSTCHWCHVMERESFENETIARQMNDGFVCVKVDREERPDVDHLYMEAVQALTGRAGWPLTVFLTPEGEPFYGGTYFPPEDKPGLPGFARVLKEVAKAYTTRRSEVHVSAKDLISHLRELATPKPGSDVLSEDTLTEAYESILRAFDIRNGGFGHAPKFPQPLVLEFLLRYHHRSKCLEPLKMANLTLGRIAAGGIRDHLGGGFHRYSVDEQWIVPHFEKMLYDNALLACVYLHAYQATGKDDYKCIVEETLDYVLREMTADSGGFYSAQDADSEGREGKYYIWSHKEILERLGSEDGRVFSECFGVTESGNLEGSNVLHVTEEAECLASRLGLSEGELRATLSRCKAQLLAVRERRIRPSIDDKIVTWLNGMMIHSLAEAASVLQSEDYRKAAVASAELAIGELWDGQALLHSYRDGRATIPAYLDDYALLIGGLLALHGATFDQRWLESADCLAEAMVELFSEEGMEGAFYDTQKDHGDLFLRPRDTSDSAKPSGSSAAVDVLLRLAVITGNPTYERHAVAALASMQQQMAAHPMFSGNWLCALDFYLAGPQEIAVIGDHQDSHTQALLLPISGLYLPNKILVGLELGKPPAQAAMRVFENRTTTEGSPAVYVCHKQTCYPPTSDPEALRGLLNLS